MFCESVLSFLLIKCIYRCLATFHRVLSRFFAVFSSISNFASSSGPSLHFLGHFPSISYLSGFNEEKCFERYFFHSASFPCQQISNNLPSILHLPFTFVIFTLATNNEFLHWKTICAFKLFPMTCS